MVAKVVVVVVMIGAVTLPPCIFFSWCPSATQALGSTNMVVMIVVIVVVMMIGVWW